MNKFSIIIYFPVNDAIIHENLVFLSNLGNFTSRNDFMTSRIYWLYYNAAWLEYSLSSRKLARKKDNEYLNANFLWNKKKNTYK